MVPMRTFQAFINLPFKLADNVTTRSLKIEKRTSLVVQWTGIHLPVLGHRLDPCPQEESTCREATKALVPQLQSPRADKPLR